MKTVGGSLLEKRASGKWLGTLCARLEKYEISDPAPFGPLALALFFYVFILFVLAFRPLWHDELYTYYIAKAPTLKQFVTQITRLDLQPPLGYVLSRISLKVLGDSQLATRMPSMVAFTGASVCLYYFARRRLGRFYGLLATLVLWLMPFSRYAVEARPYGLVIGFFALAMLGWQEVIEGSRRRLGLLAITVGGWGMILSQVFSPLLVVILGVAELVRSVERGKVDWPVWVALLAPTPFVAVYIPIIRHFEAWSAIPPEFQASIVKITLFYGDVLSAVSVVLLVAMIAALFAYRSQVSEVAPRAFSARRHEIALVLGLLSLPIIINLALMRTGGAFWGRYCIPTGLGFTLLFIYVIAKFTNGSRAAAAIASLFVSVGMVSGMVLQMAQSHGTKMVRQLAFTEVDPSLPLVDASGLTFLEMNKRESDSVLSRVFYLTDRRAAMHYAHATIFEDTGILHQYWPIRGTVRPYQEFVRNTPHFFVLGTPDYPEDWLIPKLLDDGAELEFKGELRGSSYKDYMIFEVRMPSNNAVQSDN